MSLLWSTQKAVLIPTADRCGNNIKYRLSRPLLLIPSFDSSFIMAPTRSFKASAAYNPIAHRSTTTLPNRPQHPRYDVFGTLLSEKRFIDNVVPTRPRPRRVNIYAETRSSTVGTFPPSTTSHANFFSQSFEQRRAERNRKLEKANSQILPLLDLDPGRFAADRGEPSLKARVRQGGRSDKLVEKHVSILITL
jgi:hypothetical protein